MEFMQDEICQSATDHNNRNCCNCNCNKNTVNNAINKAVSQVLEDEFEYNIKLKPRQNELANPFNVNVNVNLNFNVNRNRFIYNSNVVENEPPLHWHPRNSKTSTKIPEDF